MGYHLVEGQVTEQAPWAYDATNDLLKSQPFYAALSANGIIGCDMQFAAYSLGTTGFHDFAMSYSIPTGKQGFVCCCQASGNGGPAKLQVMYNTVDVFDLVIPTGGGTVQLDCTWPHVVPAGTVVDVAAYNWSALTVSLSARVAVALF